MEISVNANQKIRKWIHPEQYQNTTLRYTPNGDFPEFMEKIIGRPKIIRLFIALDEVWDNRDDSYHWDYRIGVNRFEGDPTHADYDWPSTVPSPLGVFEQEYLTSHAAAADEAMLNLRRYEREVADGIVSIEKYKEVVKNVIRYYKDLCPNIVYIECCNEVELKSFGGIKISEYYELYKAMASAVTELNTENNYEKPLQIGGYAMSGGVSNWHYWEEFLTLLSKDRNYQLDYYSMHEYSTDPRRVVEFYVKHMQRIKELGLPNLPLFMTEFGLRVGKGDAGRPNNLQNASGEIPGMILSTNCPGLYVFPWCSFHNPNQQLGRTMFIQNEEGQYLSTPNAHAMKMFHDLGTEELSISNFVDNQAVATIDDNNVISILATNPKNEDETFSISIENLPYDQYKVTEYMVNQTVNNCLTNPKADRLLPTLEYENTVAKNNLSLELLLNPNSFVFIKVEAR